MIEAEEREARRLHATVLLSQGDAEYSLALTDSDVDGLRRAERFAQQAEVAFADLDDALNTAKARHNRAIALHALARVVGDTEALRAAAELCAAAAEALRGQGDQVLYARALLFQGNALLDGAVCDGRLDEALDQEVEALLCEAERAFEVAGDGAGLAEVRLVRGAKALRSSLGVSLFGAVGLEVLVDRAVKGGVVGDVAAASAILEGAAEELVRHGALLAAGNALQAQGLAVFVLGAATGDVNTAERGGRLLEQAAEKFREAGHRRDQALALSAQTSALVNLAGQSGSPAFFQRAMAAIRAALSLAPSTDHILLAALRFQEAQVLAGCAMASSDVEEWRAASGAVDEALGGFPDVDASLKASLLLSQGWLLGKIADKDEDLGMFLASGRAFEGAFASSTEMGLGELATNALVGKGVALGGAAAHSGERADFQTAVAALESAVQRCHQHGDSSGLAMAQISLAGSLAELAIRDKDVSGFRRATSMLSETAVRFEALGNPDGAQEARAFASGLHAEWDERVGNDEPLASADGGEA